jgi:hypothetical protein
VARSSSTIITRTTELDLSFIAATRAGVRILMESRVVVIDGRKSNTHTSYYRYGDRIRLRTRDASHEHGIVDDSHNPYRVSAFAIGDCKGSTGMAMGTQHLKGGAGIPVRRHEQDEILVVQEDGGTAIMGESRQPVEKGATIFIPNAPEACRRGQHRRLERE